MFLNWLEHNYFFVLENGYFWLVHQEILQLLGEHKCS